MERRFKCHCPAHYPEINDTALLFLTMFPHNNICNLDFCILKYNMHIYLEMGKAGPLTPAEEKEKSNRPVANYL